jgi:hypothetical protein
MQTRSGVHSSQKSPRKYLTVIGLFYPQTLVSAALLKAKAVQDEVRIINLCTSFTYEFLMYECL